MNIQQELLKEKKLTKQNALRIADYTCSSKKYFEELMQCFLSNEYRLAQRAAWCVSWAAKIHPHYINPYIKTLIEQLPRKDLHAAVIRNSIRILQHMEIPADLHGDLMNICFEFVQSLQTPIAIKAFALTTLYNLSKVYPEIKNELKLIIEENWQHETAAFKSRGKAILKAFNSTK